MMDEDTDEQEETDDDDEDYAKPTRKSNLRSSLASSPKKQTKRNSRQQKSATKVQFHPSSNRHTKSAPPNKRSANPTKRTKSNALSTLARKVLDSSETPKTSLVAGLLSSFRPVAESDSDSATYVVLEDDHRSQPRTMYTPQLKKLAQEVVELHNSDPNKAQVQLINLMFRSVGGGVESNLDPERTVMEDMDSDMWDEATTNVFVDMQEATSDRILFHSDPMGAVHAEQLEKKRDKAEHVETSSVGVTPSSLGVREYRKIYEEFWYILGEIALTEGNMSSISGKNREDDRDEESSDEEEESSNEGRKRKKRQSSSSRKRKRDVNTNFSSTIRFDTNLAQDLLNYVTNLTSTGQSDMRAVSSTAAFFIAHAVIDKTLLIEEKLGTAAKQYLSATRTSKKDKLSERAESLKNQIDSLKRSRADLDELIISSVLSGVFAFRYRDTNMFIRASCLQALARMMVRRPDKFLATTYLKYFGWMMNDKDDCVRVAALEGLHRPFQQCETAEQLGNEKIDLSQMTDLFAKYLPRIAQCNRDVSASVQERAMQLLLSLCKEGFLEEIENDDFFDSIFLYAVDKNASPTVRRDALYFVMLQMEIFDTEVLTSNEGKNEKILLRRLDEIASWAADTLTSTNAPIGKIKVELVDYLVYSLRQMPEHKRLVTDFSIMLRTIQNDNSVINHSGNASGDKADVAKQRILVQMLTCAIEAEVQTVVSPKFLEGDREPLVSEVESAALQGVIAKKSSVKASRDLKHEHISVVLMKALPGLLEKFKSDVSISRSLCKVPRYLSESFDKKYAHNCSCYSSQIFWFSLIFIVPSVFSLPQRKTDFIALTKNLSEIFLQSTDSDVLDNIIRSLMHLSKDGHARSLEGKLAFRKIVSGLCRCIQSQLCPKTDVENGNASPRRRSSRNSQVSSNGSEVDAELSLYYDLQRLSSLARSLDVLNCRSDDDKHVFEKICSTVADGLTKRLNEGKSILHDEDASESSISSHLWETDSILSAVTAATVEHGLLFLLYALAWSLKKAISDEGVVLVDDLNEGDNDSIGQTEEDYSTHKVLILRNQLISLVEKCFDQRLIEGKEPYTSAKKIWSTRIQHSGSVIAADIRTLFPKEWSNADSAFLRSVALINDQKLIGGFTLFFRSQENNEVSNCRRFLH
jgi:cohesin complex subunit SA-1/2